MDEFTKIQNPYVYIQTLYQCFSSFIDLKSTTFVRARYSVGYKMHIKQYFNEIVPENLQKRLKMT